MTRLIRRSAIHLISSQLEWKWACSHTGRAPLRWIKAPIAACLSITELGDLLKFPHADEVFGHLAGEYVFSLHGRYARERSLLNLHLKS
jgi:hypothetical protein